MPPQEDLSGAEALTLDHVEFYVEDAEKYAAHLQDQYAFRVVARSPEDQLAEHFSIAVRQDAILLVLTQALRDSHPAAEYVRRHGDGVAAIALRTPDARTCFQELCSRGADPVDRPGALAVRAFGDTVHTLLERADPEQWCPPGLVPVDSAPARPAAGDEVGLQRVDHFAVCLEPGQLDACIRYYEGVFGFQEIFEEHIVVGRQAMISKVVQSRAQDVTLTILEPDTTREPGQIDDFLAQHGGAGVQHVAFSSGNVLTSVATLQERGVEFLAAPGSYFDFLPQRIDVTAYDIAALRRLNILVDSDHGGQLFQIFTRTTHPRHTLFFEVIERLGATTFGSGNIKALYEAKEAERVSIGDGD